MIWTKAFWKGLAERGFKSAAQGFVAGAGLSITATQIGDGTGVALFDVPWLLGVESALIMLALSVVTSIGNADFTAGPKQFVLARGGQVAGPVEGSGGSSLDADAGAHRREDAAGPF